MNLATRLKIIVLIAAFITAVIGVGLATRLILDAIGPHPAIAEALYWTIVLSAGLGGLIAFWFLLSRVQFLWRGYRVGFRQGRAYYEERDASGEPRGFAFDLFPLTEGYRPRSLVRLSPLVAWDLDAPVWARGRRDDIAGRITKDLSSYEGWPALLIPDAPAVDSTAGGNPASALIRAVLERWPEWASYVISGAETGRTDRVLLSVPPPEHPSHRLEVAHRGDTFEIAYECGEPGLRAATRFGLADGAAAVFCVCEFLRELRDGELVVVVRRLPLLARRSDRARYNAQFLSVSHSVRYSRWCVYDWRTERNQSAGLISKAAGGLGFVSGRRVDFDREPRHQRAASRRRISAHGMVCTAPLSSSATRRLTSVAHAASASSSTSVSRLSSSNPARAARTSFGSASASFRISAASRFIVLILPVRAVPKGHGDARARTVDLRRRRGT